MDLALQHWQYYVPFNIINIYCCELLLVALCRLKYRIFLNGGICAIVDQKPRNFPKKNHRLHRINNLCVTSSPRCIINVNGVQTFFSILYSLEKWTQFNYSQYIHGQVAETKLKTEQRVN